MKTTDKNDRFRRYRNRALIVFWAVALVLSLKACNVPAYAVTEQAEPPFPEAWESDPMAGIVLEPVSEEAAQ